MHSFLSIPVYNTIYTDNNSHSRTSTVQVQERERERGYLDFLPALNPLPPLELSKLSASSCLSIDATFILFWRKKREKGTNSRTI